VHQGCKALAPPPQRRRRRRRLHTIVSFQSDKNKTLKKYIQIPIQRQTHSVPINSLLYNTGNYRHHRYTITNCGGYAVTLYGGLTVIRKAPPPDSHAISFYAQALFIPSDPANIYFWYRSQLSQLCIFKRNQKLKRFRGVAREYYFKQSRNVTWPVLLWFYYLLQTTN
jgi:hypothetical protein